MKVYFLRENLSNYQIFPIPQNLQDFVEIDIENELELDNKQLIYFKNEYILIDKCPDELHKWNGKKWIEDKLKKQARLQEVKAKLIDIIAERADNIKSNLLVGYPQTEIDSFYRQEKEALAYQEDKTADTPMLKMIAQARGVPFDLLVQKVIEKSNQFAVAIGVIIGQRQKFEDRILAAQNLEELENIKMEVAEWKFTLEN
ncbi:hypothetical protein ACFSAV_07750 [Pasteurella oralis]|uniref:Uncharacterized protein n=1 Tax=Pasteurella oralis TaxID=1071947 RepID=A0ABW4NUF0_9PAST